MKFEDLNTIASENIEFHNSLNPLLFDNNQLKPNIRRALLAIAKDFEDYIGLDLNIDDITISGSNAAYSYTPESDIDLHLVVAIKDSTIKELLDAKKNLYNSTYEITVKGIDVELYAQDRKEKHFSQGIYSVLNNKWISVPKKIRVNINDQEVHKKYKNYRDRIRTVLSSDNIDVVKSTWDTIKKIRKAGLNKSGEFGIENLVFKLLRSNGWIEKLQTKIIDLKSQSLSVETQEAKIMKLIDLINEQELSELSMGGSGISAAPTTGTSISGPGVQQMSDPKTNAAMITQQKKLKDQQRTQLKTQIDALNKELNMLRQQLAGVR